MEKHKIKILSTRPLEDSLLAMAAENNISITVIPFIDVEPVQSPEIIEQIKAAASQQGTVAFTSMNAAEIVGRSLDGSNPDWKIFSIGTATTAVVKSYFGEEKIADTASNAATLAESILKHKIDKLIFFCGNQRRNELPDLLMQQNIPVNEVIVYNTINIPQIIEEQFDGVAFFSPSAVDSFFLLNDDQHSDYYFAIGTTTEAAIHHHSNKRVVVSALPGKENLIRRIIEFYKEAPEGRQAE